MSFRIEREMTISHADFMRGLPSVLNDAKYSTDGNQVKAEWENRMLQILLSPESWRSLGRMTLPVTHVEFVFSEFSEPEVQRFLKRFDMYYRRGGG